MVVNKYVCLGCPRPPSYKDEGGEYAIIGYDPSKNGECGLSDGKTTLFLTYTSTFQLISGFSMTSIQGILDKYGARISSVSPERLVFDSASNSLACSNELYESGKVAYAYPNFVTVDGFYQIPVDSFFLLNAKHPEVVFPDRLDAYYCEGGKLAVFVKNNKELTKKGYKVWASYNNGDSVVEIKSLYTYTYLQPKPGTITFYSENNKGDKNEKSYSVQYLEPTQINIIASDTAVCENSSFSLRVDVTGAVPISFKWACNNEIIPNSQDLEVLTIPKGEHGIYSYDLKEISGGCNPTVKHTAQVNLLKTPQSIKLNSNPKICNGISDIKAQATEDSLNYIWVANSNIIPSENKELLSTAFNDGAYDVYAVGYYVEQCKCYSDTIHVDAAKVEPTAVKFANQSRVFCQTDEMNIIRKLVSIADSNENIPACSSKYRFESSDNNLKVDGINGYIDLERSEPGEYALSMYVNNSDASNPVFCEILQDTMIIEVVPLPSPFTIHPAEANLSMQGDTIILNSSQDFTVTSSMQDTVIWYRNDIWEHLGETWCDKTTNIPNVVYRAKAEHKGCARHSNNLLFIRREH